MKPITAEWVAKAEGDFAVMEREINVRDNPSHDAICFHAQQCAEKYLKARLCEEAVSFRNTHDLVVLLDSVLPVQPEWEVFRQDLAYLSDFAVSFRYPGESADRESALQARSLCSKFREAARVSLGLATQEG